MVLSHWRSAERGWLRSAVVMAAAVPGVVFAADLEFTRHIISTTNTGVRCVQTADIDKDGDLDILSAITEVHLVAWYENDGAQTPSFTEHIIARNRNRSNFIIGIDINGDDHMDIVSSSAVDDTIGWYENDGAPDPTFTEWIITEDLNGVDNPPPGFADGVRQIFAVDIDGDDDIDLGHASVNDDKVAWYENDGALSPSWTFHTLTEDPDGAEEPKEGVLDGCRAITAADLDGDDDMDIIAGPWFGESCIWFDNQGGMPPTFIERVVVTFPPGQVKPEEVAGLWRLETVDLDNDNDLDILGARRFDGIEWFENDGQVPPNFVRHTIAGPAIALLGKSVNAADLDDDGDMDPMSASVYLDKIAWHENDGAPDPSFTERVITEDPDGHGGALEGVADEARTVFPSDVDGDGDIDVLWGAKVSNTIAWEENHLIEACPTDLDNDGVTGVNELLMMLGGWGAGAQGPPDFDGSGIVDIGDLLILLGVWGPCPRFAGCGPGGGACFAANGTPGCNEVSCCETVCAVMPDCCITEWDAACAAEAVVACGQCGEAGAGDCCAANGSVGCDDLTCCGDVCAADAFCCTVEWDAMCATSAASVCSCP